MRIRIIVSYIPRYQRGHRWDFVPPVTAIHLAALVPQGHEVEVVHEQVQPVPFDEPLPDLVLLSFFSGFARRAYQHADRYRQLGVKVIAGGPHVSYWTDEALQHVDAVVTGEADDIFAQVINDAEAGCLQRVYRGGTPTLQGLPTPRYDLLEPRFLVPRVLQATRGCPFTCRFCSVPDLNPGFRVRPIEDVVRDIASTHFPHFWQERVTWFWDDNLLVNRPWAKQLLREMRGLNRWWLTQASIDITADRELLDLMQQSGCIGIFLGIESLEESELRSVDKKQNRVSKYRDAIARLHERGICVMAGFIAGFDGQTPDSIVRIADGLNAIGVDVPFLSVLTPFRGTPLYDDFIKEDRILRTRNWDHYNGYNVAFQPQGMSPETLRSAHRQLWQRAFSPSFVAARLMRGVRQLSRGGMMLSAAMNGFYGLKQVTGNIPATAAPLPEGIIEHPTAAVAPVRLATLTSRRGVVKRAYAAT